MGSIERALEIIHFKREEEQEHRKFKAIINSVTDGIIATNERNEISIVNDSFWKLFQLGEKNIIGKHIAELIPDYCMEEQKIEYPSQDKIITLGHSTLNMTRTAILAKGLKLGDVYTFQDISKIKKIEQKHRLENDAKGLIAKNHFEDIIYASEIMKQVVERAQSFAKTDSTILLTGETGTGKEILAQSIHNFSPRRFAPFVAINCAALPEALLESELFGYEDGAFTGASKKGKKGLFELAHNGTVFLDEINSISLHFQARLLRVLQEKEIVRIGGTKVIPIDVRIIAAANQDLMDLVLNKQFRVDLFYRLNLLKLTLPPLRSRLDDMIPIARQYISDKSRELYNIIEPIFEKIFKELFTHHFMGNIRELLNILERFLILCEKDRKNDLNYYINLLLECVDDYKNVNQTIKFELQDSYKESLLEAERSLMIKYIHMFRGDKSMLSKKLGIGRTTLYRKLKELHIEN